MHLLLCPLGLSLHEKHRNELSVAVVSEIPQPVIEDLEVVENALCSNDTNSGLLVHAQVSVILVCIRCECLAALVNYLALA